jgi:pimeloyl-ACP methyl ester carboxylesterase
LTHPGRIEKLVIADMTPLATPPRYQAIIAALQHLDFEAAANRRDLDAQLAPHIPGAGLRQFLLMNIETLENGRPGWRIDLNAIANGYDDTNKAIDLPARFSGPTLFLRGEKSDYIGDKDVQAIEALFPQAAIATVAGAGHWLHADRAEEFARLVLEFL